MSDNIVYQTSNTTPIVSQYNPSYDKVHIYEDEATVHIYEDMTDPRAANKDIQEKSNLI